MKKYNKKIYLSLIISLFFVFFGLTKITQAQTPPTSCYSGNWVQPTCNPVTSDPGQCGILPPLFSGANCGQHTGYLRIQKESEGNNQRYWVVLDGAMGQIRVGANLGSWVYNTTSNDFAGIYASGPITSGQFNSYPGSGGGSIIAQNTLRSQGTLVVGTNTFTSGFISASGAVKISASPVSVGGSNTASLYIEDAVRNENTTVYIKQTEGTTGRILDLHPGNIDDGHRKNVYFDNLGYLNSTNDFQIRFDADGDRGRNEFRINNFDNQTVFTIDERGNTNIDEGSLSVENNAVIGGNLTAGSVVADSGQGTISGKFVQSINGNPCSNEQLLVYEVYAGVGNWYCRSVSSVGGNQTLIQVLQADADASAFASHVQIGTDNNGLTLIGPETGLSGPASINLKNREAVSLVNRLMGVINFGDAYNVPGQAKIEVSRGAPGGGGNYPTNMSFWTTPVGFTIAQERLTILHNGNVGIGIPIPTTKLHINDAVSGPIISLSGLTTNYNGIAIRNTAGAEQWFYGANNSNNFVIRRNNTTDNLTISSSGNIGINQSTPTDLLHLFKSDFPSMTIAGPGGSGQIALATASGLYSDFAATNDFVIRSNIGDLILTARNPFGDIRFGTNNSDIERMTILSTGRVGIGTPSPSALLHLAHTTVSPDIRLAGYYIMSGSPNARYPTLSFYNDTQKRAQIISDVSDGSYLMDYSGNLGGVFRVRSQLDDNAATVLLINQSGNVGINNVSPTARLDVTGTIRGTFVGASGALCANGQVLVFNGTSWNCGSVTGSDNLGNHTATQDLNMANFSIINAATVSANKITVNTIDPVYTIGGEKYATYVASMTGVKEETAGLLELELDKSSGLVSGKIDFTLLAKGSDLWIFAQTINYQENFEQIVVLLTSAFDGRVWYDKDVAKKILTIYAKPINQLTKRYEVSYRLTGPRFDYKDWGNTTDEDTEGLNIDKFLQDR